MLVAAGHAAAGRARRGLNRFQPEVAAAPTRRWPCCWPRSSAPGGCAVARGRCRPPASCAPPRWPRASRRRSACGRSTSTRRPKGCGAANASGTTACTCSRTHVIVENVDDDGRAVPDGEPGARLLVTNLVNRVQPLIRLEITDAMTLTARAVRVRAHAAAHRAGRGTCRRRDVAAGRRRAPVAVHPMQFWVVARDRDVVEFQVLQEGARLVVLVVGRGVAPGARGAAARGPSASGCERCTWRASRSTSAGAMPSSARRAASCRSSWPIARRSPPSDPAPRTTSV